MILKQKIDFLNGSIVKSFLLFSIPILISNIFQQMYNTVDAAIVGHYLGESSFAAIGASSAIFDTLLGFALGIGTGFSIVVARNHGAGDKNMLKQTVAGSLISGGVLTLIISVVSSFFMMPFLRLLQIPDNIIKETYIYVLINTIFAFVLFAYNLCAGLLRSVGDSLAPLVILIFSSLLNVGLNILLITQFHMGVTGAAVATVATQGISVILCIIYIIKKHPELVPQKEHFRYNAKLYKDLVSQGLSYGLMLSVVNIGSLILQVAINGLGYLIIAAHMAARKIIFLCFVPFTTLSLTLTTFVSQNRGAGNKKRIKKGIRSAMIMSSIWSALLTIVIMFTATAAIRLVSGSEEQIIIENGTKYLIINLPFYFVLGILLMTRCSMQGLGKKVIPVVSSIIELLVKAAFAFWIVPALGYFGVILCEPVVWCLMCVQLVCSFRTVEKTELSEPIHQTIYPSNYANVQSNIVKTEPCRIEH